MFYQDFLAEQNLPPMTPFVFAGPENTPGDSVVEKYRNYYRAKDEGWREEGKRSMNWKNRQVPDWFVE